MDLLIEMLRDKYTCTVKDIWKPFYEWIERINREGERIKEFDSLIRCNA